MLTTAQRQAALVCLVPGVLGLLGIGALFLWADNNGGVHHLGAPRFFGSSLVLCALLTITGVLRWFRPRVNEAPTFRQKADLSPPAAPAPLDGAHVLHLGAATLQAIETEAAARGTETGHVLESAWARVEVSIRALSFNEVSALLAQNGAGTRRKATLKLEPAVFAEMQREADRLQTTPSIIANAAWVLDTKRG